jgi:hypothetical protein
MTTTSPASNYSDPFQLDLLKRLGGGNLYDYMLVAWLERLEEDPHLKKYYKGWNGYESHQVLLKLAFTMESDSNISSHPVWLRFYHQFEQGMNEKHFDIILEHFEAVLQENWIEQATIDDALKMLRCLREVFESKANEHEQREFATKRDILALRSQFDECLEQKQVGDKTTEASGGLLHAMKALALPARRTLSPTQDISIAKAA